MIRRDLMLDSTILMFLALIGLGVAALCVGSVLHYEVRTMRGIAIGCIPTGILGAGVGMAARRWMAANRPDVLRRERDAQDERNRYIQRQATHVSFWVFYAYIFLYTLLSPTKLIEGISHSAFGSATLALMSAVYLVTLLLFGKRY